MRVRHRDETKTVSRLTMENMNLASRCREAITHVAMLKKELLVQQRRVEELERQQQQLPPSALASAVAMGQQQQQQQQQQMATPMQQRAPPQTPPMSADMKQALAASPPPPPPAGPPPPSANKRVSPNSTLDRQSSQRQEKRGSDGSGGSGSGGSAAAPFVSGGANRVLAAKAQQQQQQQMPASVDDDFSDEDEVDNFLDDTPDDELDVDDVTDKLSKEAFFGEEPGRPAQHLPTTPEKEDAVVGTNSPMGQVKSQPKRKIQKGVDPDIGRPPSPVFSNAAMVKARTEMSTMSSIDAFEASFDTTFPTSFQSAVQKDGPAPSLDISFDVPDFSDPFYLGSDGDGGNISFPDSHGPSPSSSGGGMSMASGGGPSAANATNSFGRANSGAKQSHLSPASAPGQVGKTPASPSPANSSFSPDLFPSSPMSELRKEPDFVGDEDVDRLSAPQFPTATPAVNGHGTSPQAPGPEKSGVGSAAARARYDAALGYDEARSNVPKSPGNAASIASKRELSNSASQVLKRIQQRRAKTGGAESPVNVADPPPESSPAQNGNAPASRFSPYGGGANATASNAADAKLAAIRNSARRAPAGGTVDDDYGPKRRTAKPYSGGGDNLAMFKATNPSPSNSKYRSANSRTASHRLSPTSMNAELDNLDAIAAQAGTVPPSAATDDPATDGTRRSGRAVKQPVSYAEPSLNSKIRKGHQYFPKQNDAAAANGTGIVAPAASPAQPR